MAHGIEQQHAVLVSALRTHDTGTDNARANVRAVKTRYLRRPQRMSFCTQVDGTLACVLGEAALGWTAHRFHWERTASRNLIDPMIAQFRGEPCPAILLLSTTLGRQTGNF